MASCFCVKDQGKKHKGHLQTDIDFKSVHFLIFNFQTTTCTVCWILVWWSSPRRWTLRSCGSCWMVSHTAIKGISCTETSSAQISSSTTGDRYCSSRINKKLIRCSTKQTWNMSHFIGETCWFRFGAPVPSWGQVKTLHQQSHHPVV